MVVKLRFASFAAAALVAASAADAQDVDFSRIPGVDAQPTVQVDLSAGMLSFVTAAAAAADPTVAEALAGIERVRVFVYSAVEDRDALATFLDDSAQRLEGSGWERTVVAEEGASKVRVHTKIGDARLAGITLMVLDGAKEAVFINIAGDIDPAQLGRAIAQLSRLPRLDQMASVMNGFPAALPTTPATAVPAAPLQPRAPGAGVPAAPERPATPARP
jgi:hypothetical protein